mmetsp:Transcript_108382/g.191960  ORF Transcript_108382/g.191960 Transcript_108382/m.191960 type:complete len:286 (-) Transcript_108382:128-985(-)
MQSPGGRSPMQSPGNKQPQSPLEQQALEEERRHEFNVKLLHRGRSAYECKSSPHRKGWNNMTAIFNQSFDGNQPRPYSFQTFGTPRARSSSGTRSVHSWQRDYNTKGLTHEQYKTLRQERVKKVREMNEKEARRRGVTVEQIEAEMTNRAYAQIRVPSHILSKKSEVKSQGDVEVVNRVYGKDGSVKLETTFDLIQAREMFRGEEWDHMEQALGSLNEGWQVKTGARTQTKPADEDSSFRPPGRKRNSRRSSKSSPPAPNRGLARGSFSAGVSAAALAQQLKSAR